MSIFLKTYRGHDVSMPPAWQSILVIFRYGLSDVIESRLFVAFFFISLLIPVGLICFLYVYHNIELLMMFEFSLDDLPLIDGTFFAFAMQIPQNFLLMVLAVAIGPAMISPDLRNNAMPLYLSRPISISDYVIGKLLVLVFLGSCMTWMPALLLIFLQAVLAGPGWLSTNSHLIFAAVLTSLLWSLVLSLMAFAVSAFVKWKAIARIFIFGIIFISSILGGVIEEISGGVSAYIVNLYAAQETIMINLYRADRELLGFIPLMSIEVAIAQFSIIMLLGLLFLVRQIKRCQGTV